MADPICVWMHPALVPKFEAWLSLNDLHLSGPMTFEPDDEPQQIHMVGIGAARRAMSQGGRDGS